MWLKLFQKSKSNLQKAGGKEKLFWSKVSLSWQIIQAGGENADILGCIFLPLFLNKSSFNLPEFFSHNLTKNVRRTFWSCSGFALINKFPLQHLGIESQATDVSIWVSVLVCLSFYFYFIYIFNFCTLFSYFTVNCFCSCAHKTFLP